jgi:hypothetical protein
LPIHSFTHLFIHFTCDRAVVNILNIPDRDWGFNADQFSGAVAEHLGPALVLQRDIKKGMLVSMYWRKLSKHGKYNSPLTYKEAWEKMETLQAEFDAAEQGEF